MLVALHDVKRIRGHVLAGDEPGLAAARFAAPQADSLALAERVEREPDMFADDGAIGRLHRAGARRQITVEELAKRPLADKADARRILLLRIGQPDLLGDGTYLRLRHLAEREERFRELRLIEPVQEVRLIFRRIFRLEQLEATVDFAHARVVPR